MKIEIVGTNIATPAVPPAANGNFGNSNAIPRGYALSEKKKKRLPLCSWCQVSVSYLLAMLGMAYLASSFCVVYYAWGLSTYLQY